MNIGITEGFEIMTIAAGGRANNMGRLESSFAW